MKSLIIFSFLALLILCSVSFAMVYQDGNAYLSVDPDTATLRADGIHQNVTFCNNMTDTVNLSSFFMFDESLMSYSLAYWNDSEYVDLSDLVTYLNESPTDFNFISSKNNIYTSPSGELAQNECAEGLLTYADSSDSGTWDIGIIAHDEVSRDDFNFEIDPYFNNTLYTNFFFSASDISDLNLTASANISAVVNRGYITLTNTTDWNATYGELISKDIPNIGSYKTINCTMAMDQYSGSFFTLKVSNDLGNNWITLRSGGSYPYCFQTSFANFGSDLMFNLTLEQQNADPDVFSSIIYNLNFTLDDWQPPASPSTAWSDTSITTQNITTIFMIWVGGLLLCTFLGLFLGMFMRNFGLNKLEAGTGDGSREMSDWPKKILYVIIIMAVISVVLFFIYILTPIGNMFT